MIQDHVQRFSGALHTVSGRRISVTYDSLSHFSLHLRFFFGLHDDTCYDFSGLTTLLNTWYLCFVLYI